MRRHVLVTYDIADPTRLRLTHAVVRDFGAMLQYSVYLCRLTGRQRAELNGRLRAVIHGSEDQVLFIDLGPVRIQDTDSIPVEEVLGRPIKASFPSTVVF